MSTPPASRLDFAPSAETLLHGATLATTVVLASLLYVAFTEATLAAWRLSLYGVVWVVVGAWVLVHAQVAPASASTKRRAAAVAVGYFAALAVAGGLVGLASAAVPASGARIAYLPPGWGPAVLYSGDLFVLVLEPARVVGYLALAYLVYATVVDAAGAAVSGVLGLLSCVSCSWPILASVVTGLLGSGSALAATAMAFSYDLSTAVFLVTVGLLYWRPLGRRPNR